MAGQEFQRQSLGTFVVHDFQEMRLGFRDVDRIAQQLAENRGQFIQEIRIIDNEHFRCLLRNELAFPIRLDVVLGLVELRVLNQLLVLFAGVQLIIDISLQVQVVLHAILEQLAYGILRNVALVEHFFIHQVLHQRPLISNDRHVKSGLAGDGLGGSISAAGGQGYDNAGSHSLLQRGLRGRGDFLVIVNQGVIDIDCNQFVHLVFSPNS
ncbi:hypothetical protein D3C73_1072330 [compost metagenome]